MGGLFYKVFHDAPLLQLAMKQTGPPHVLRRIKDHFVIRLATLEKQTFFAIPSSIEKSLEWHVSYGSSPQWAIVEDTLTNVFLTKKSFSSWYRFGGYVF